MLVHRRTRFLSACLSLIFFFFFQAEDGIRDTSVTGVQRVLFRSQFADVGSFLTNNPSRFQGGIVSTLSPRNVRQTIFGGYLQDDWRWLPNLTLNLGLRSEERRVGKECRYRAVEDHLKKKQRVAIA